MQTVNLTLRRHLKPGQRGYQYDVLLNGEILVTSSDPEFSACRELVSRGITGEARFWREGKDTWDICVPDIQRSAKCRTANGSNQNTVFVKWVPLPEDAFATAEAA